MSRTLLALATAGVGLLFATDLHGQAPSHPTPGQTVRITKQNGFRRTGVLRTITSDSLTIEIGNGLGPMTYALANVSTIEEKTGTYTSGRTILTTMAVTTLAGGLILGIGSAGCEGWLCPTPAEGFAIGLLAGAALGLPLGLVLTPLIRYDRWELVSMPASPTRVGFGLSVTVPLPAW